MAHAVTYDIPYIENRNRGTVAIRLILAFPLIIVNALWSYFVSLLGLVQWFIILFTGKRNEGIWNMQNQWLGFAVRVSNYIGLMYDEYPPFGTDPGNVPVIYQFQFSEDANRLSNFFRIIWVIPAAIVTMLYVIAAEVLGIIAWFAILITGKMPKGIFDFMLKAHRQGVRTQSYSSLMTDVYPKATP